MTRRTARTAAVTLVLLLVAGPGVDADSIEDRAGVPVGTSLPFEELTWFPAE